MLKTLFKDIKKGDTLNLENIKKIKAELWYCLNILTQTK